MCVAGRVAGGLGRAGDRARGRGSAGGAGAASSRSLRAERRRRRRRRRRRGRCSRRGREPCQENTTSQLRPSMPAAQRSEARPPALLPPLGPRLGPIVCSARRRRREGGGRRRGEPCAKVSPRSEPRKVISVRASDRKSVPPQSLAAPGRPSGPESGRRKAGARPRQQSLVPTGGCGSGSRV